MHWTTRTVLFCTAFFSAVSFSTVTSAQTNPFTKAQVADLICKVEEGVEEFQKYLNNRGEDAKNQAESAQSSEATSRRQCTDSTSRQNLRNQAKQTKDDLEDAMDVLNRSTNRLRRKFDPTSNYLETKAQMEQVMDSARRVRSGDDQGELWHAGKTLPGSFAREYQRLGAVL